MHNLRLATGIVFLICWTTAGQAQPPAADSAAVLASVEEQLVKVIGSAEQSVVALGILKREAAPLRVDGFGLEIGELLDAGDTVIALGHYTGTFKATGRAQRTQMAHVWRMRDGKACAFQQYANTLHIAQVMGRV